MVEDTNSEIFEPPFTQKRVQNEFKKEVEKRREEIENLIIKIGFKNARKMYKSLADHYKISERMIYKDFNWVKGNLRPNLKEIKIDLYIAREKILSEALMLLNNAITLEEKNKAINTLINSAKFYREEMEAWGEKPRIAEENNINMSEELDTNLILRLAQESRERRKNMESSIKKEIAGDSQEKVEELKQRENRDRLSTF
jgi:hypothetical protein